MERTVDGWTTRERRRTRQRLRQLTCCILCVDSISALPCIERPSRECVAVCRSFRSSGCPPEVNVPAPISTCENGDDCEARLHAARHWDNSCCGVLWEAWLCCPDLSRKLYRACPCIRSGCYVVDASGSGNVAASAPHLERNPTTYASEPVLEATRVTRNCSLSLGAVLMATEATYQ